MSAPLITFNGRKSMRAVVCQGKKVWYVLSTEKLVYHRCICNISLQIGTLTYIWCVCVIRV